MTKIRDLHAEWMKDPDYRAEYKRLEPEFELAIAIIKSRIKEENPAIDTKGDAVRYNKNH